MEGEGYQLPEGGDSSSAVQELLQQRNFLRWEGEDDDVHSPAHPPTLTPPPPHTHTSHRNLNPRDPLNINLRKAFLEYDKNL